MKNVKQSQSISAPVTIVIVFFLGALGISSYACQTTEDVKADHAKPGGSERCFTADLKGPVMVEVPAKNGTTTYCIDSTEVTLGQYKAFVAEVADDLSWQDPRCEGENSSYSPTPLYKPEPDAMDIPQWDQPDNMPVNYVDWCDATAYCKWAGKRLCGRLGGGGVDNPAIFNDDMVAVLSGEGINQWYNACTQQETSLYSTGDSCDESKCANWWKTPTVYSRNENCHGSTPAFDQVFDLSGSVNEWVDECANYRCLALSGAYDDSDLSAYRCGLVSMAGLSSQSYDIGFRCCKD